MLSNLHMLKEVYNFLQSKSPSYPWIDAKTLMKFLIDEMDIIKNHTFKVAIYNIILETCVQGEIVRGEENSRLKRLQRYQLMEVLIRISFFLYSNAVVKMGMVQHDIDEENELSPS